MAIVRLIFVTVKPQDASSTRKRCARSRGRW